MLAKLKQFIEAHLATQAPEQQQYSLNMAAACLLLEVVYADQILSDAEAALLPQILCQTLGLSREDSAALITEANQTQQQAVSLFEFTHAINQHFDLPKKKQLLLAMWQLALADGKLSFDEEQLIRRLADLLHLRHAELTQLRDQAALTAKL